MSVYNVCTDGDGRFYVQGYPTGRTSSTVETKRTSDRDQAERWAERMNAGERVPEAGGAVYADD